MTAENRSASSGRRSAKIQTASIPWGNDEVFLTLPEVAEIFRFR